MSDQRDLIDALKRAQELPGEEREPTRAEIETMNRKRSEASLKLWPVLSNTERADYLAQLREKGYNSLADKLEEIK